MTTAERLFDEAMALPPGERKELAESLLRSLPEAVAAWEAELRRRMEDIDSGRDDTVPWDEALERIFEKSAR